MKSLRSTTLSLLLFTFVSAMMAADKPTVPHAIEAPTRFDSRLGFEVAPVVFVIDTKPTLEAAGIHRFDLIEARDTPAGRKAVRDSSSFGSFMNSVLGEAARGISRLHLLRYEDVGVYRPDTLELTLPNQERGVPIGAWILGLVITEVQPGGLAESKEIEPGYFVEEVNGRRGGARTTATGLFLAAQEAVAKGEALELVLMKWRPLAKSAPDANAAMTGKKKTVVFLPEELATNRQ